MPSSTTRRGFLQTAAGAAAVSVVPALGQAPPSEQLTHAVIGCGGMGTGHIKMVTGNRNARLLAVCDVDSKRLAKAVENGGEGVTPYHDFREVLDRGDIDVVHIVTPPHWHAIMSVMAAEAGCDIWCEKPMTRTIGEGPPVIDAVQRHGRIFRLNTWFRLESQFYGLGTPVKPLKQLVESGLLGWPLTVRISPVSYTHLDVYKRQVACSATAKTTATISRAGSMKPSPGPTGPRPVCSRPPGSCPHPVRTPIRRCANGT